MSGKKIRNEEFSIAMTKWVGSSTSLVVHTVLFAGSFLLAFLGVVGLERMLLVVTTIVSLEAIYLAIFIQMSLNQANQIIEAVEEDIDEIQEDIDEIQEDVDEIQKDVDEIQEDVDEIQKDVDEIEEAEEEDEARKRAQKETLAAIETGLSKLLADFERLKSK